MELIRVAGAGVCLLIWSYSSIFSTTGRFRSAPDSVSFFDSEGLPSHNGRFTITRAEAFRSGVVPDRSLRRNEARTVSRDARGTLLWSFVTAKQQYCANTPHDWTVSEVADRTSTDVGLIFGTHRAQITPEAFRWGDSTRSDFKDLQGYYLHAVPGYSAISIEGSFRPTGSQTRHPKEQQMVIWDIVVSRSGDPRDAVLLESDSFTIQSGRLTGVGRNSLRGVRVGNFSGAAYVAVWLKVVYRNERSTGGFFGVADDLVFTFHRDDSLLPPEPERDCENAFCESSCRAAASSSSPASSAPSAPAKKGASRAAAPLVPAPPSLAAAAAKSSRAPSPLADSMRGYTVWINDFHAGPVGGNMDHFRELGIKLNAQIEFWNCGFFDVCKRNLKVLAFDDWRGFGLEPCPQRTRREFFEAYKNDPEMQQADVFMCSHPLANCELFLPFNRSIVLYATTRLEFGRNDDVVEWRQPYLSAARSPRRWAEWVHNVQRIAANPRNTIAANNLFDVNYIRYHTGVPVKYIPSWCGYVGSVTYKPTRPQLLIGPYRDNLGLPPWNDRRKHPLIVELDKTVFRESQRRKRDYDFRFLSEMYPGPPGYTYQDLASHRLMVQIPYQTSVMSWFEYYRLNVPLFFPSYKLLLEWQRKYDLTWERVYGHPEVLVKPYTAFSPNSDQCDDVAYWLQFSDWLVWPHVQLFDSWEHLLDLIDTVDLFAVSRKMAEFNECVGPEILARWHEVFSRATGGTAPGGRPIPQDFDDALAEGDFAPPIEDGPSCLNTLRSNLLSAQRMRNAGAFR